MTLPNTPLEEWLSSSSSLQNVGQGGGICRLLLSSPLPSRNRLPNSPPSFDPEGGEEWLQEARALPLENAPSILIKPFSGRHAAWHAGGIRVDIRVGIRVVMVQRFRARCHSVCYSNCYSELLQYLMRPFMRPHGHPHEVPDLAFSSCFRVTVLATVATVPRTRKRRLWCQFRLALRSRAPWASLMPVTRNKPIKP